MSRLAITARIWRGILLLWRNTDAVIKIKTQPFTTDGRVAKHMKQRDLDDIIAAVNWAERMEERSN